MTTGFIHVTGMYDYCINESYILYVTYHILYCMRLPKYEGYNES